MREVHFLDFRVHEYGVWGRLRNVGDLRSDSDIHHDSDFEHVIVTPLPYSFPNGATEIIGVLCLSAQIYSSESEEYI